MKRNRTKKSLAGVPPGRSGCRRWRSGCFFFIFLICLAICGFLALIIYPRSAQANSNDNPLAVWLLIDNSNSMFDKAGVGSDPELLRLDAARLFLTYLGIDERDTKHRAGVIFFGSEASTAVPLTPLTTEEQRAQLFAQIANPPRQGWTDHLAALDLAQAQLNTLPPAARSAVIMLTDGKPEWDDTPSEADQAAYLAALQTRSQVLASSGTPLFIILLANAATDSDPEIADRWQPLWQQMSAATPSGAYFVARNAADLPGIYHDIVALLTGNLTEGIVFEMTVSLTGAQASITVPPNLTQLTLVIGKEEPDQTIQLVTATGQLLQETDEGVRQAGGNGRTHEEIWVIEQPLPGEWTIFIEGAGHITIWQDSKLAPAATPTLALVADAGKTPALETATALPTFAGATPTLTTTTPTSSPTLEPTVTDRAEGSTVKPADPFGWLWALGAGGLLFMAGSGVVLVRQARLRPRLTGTLRLLHGVQTAKGESVVELDSLKTGFFRLGYPPADLPLTMAQSQVVLYPGHTLDEAEEILVRNSGGAAMVNGEILHDEKRLDDMAILDLGGVQIRYENLRLRQAQREKERQLARGRI